MMFRRLLAREYRRIFERTNEYSLIQELQIPDRNEKDCCERGEAVAERIALIGYQFCRAHILGYSRGTTYSRLVRELDSAYESPKITKASPSRFQPIGDFRKAKRVCQRVESQVLLPTWRKQRDGLFNMDGWAVAIAMERQLDVYSPIPSIEVSFGEVVVSAEKLIHSDFRSYLRFSDLELFENRYRNVISLVDMFCRNLLQQG